MRIRKTKDELSERESGDGGAAAAAAAAVAAALLPPLDAPDAEGTRRAPLFDGEEEDKEAPGVSPPPTTPPPSVLPPAALPFSLPKSFRVPPSLEPLRRRTHSRWSVSRFRVSK